jgi:hypothetical protein
MYIIQYQTRVDYPEAVPSHTKLYMYLLLFEDFFRLTEKSRFYKWHINITIHGI